MKLKPFQEKLVFQGIPGKIYSLQQNLGLALSKDKKQVIAFQSPTGTGKTVMLSKLIDSYRNQEVAFVWVGPSDGGLVLQSLAKVNKLVQLGLVFEDLSSDSIPQGQVLFIGWSQVNRISSEGFESKIMNNESKDLPQVIANTRSKRKLVVIVDESHIGATKPSNSQEVLNTVFKANVEIHISATNTSIDFADYKTIVTQEMREEIIDAGIIKKELKMGQLGVHGDDALEKAIFSAEEMRKKVRLEYQSLKEDINPLVLIQAKNANNDQLKNIETILKKINKTYDNKTLALWMDGKKHNTEGLEDNYGVQEYLIFKQAIATGWDCPRSHILVQLRETGSKTFEIQVLGRIARNPLLRKTDNEILNTGFVYSDIPGFDIEGELISNPKDVYSSLKIKNPLEKIVTSTYKEFLGQSSLDRRIVNQIIGKDWVNNQLSELNSLSVNSDELIKNFKTFKMDYLEALYFVDNEDAGITEGKDSFAIKMPDYQIEESAKKMILNRMPGFKTKESSQVILQLVEDVYEGEELIYKIILSNKDYFENFVANVISEYQKNSIQTGLIDYELKENDKFTLPEKEYHFKLIVKENKDFKKYLYQPCFLTRSQKEYDKDSKFNKNLKKVIASSGEVTFRKFLEDSKKIEWWYQSGTDKGVHLGIPYQDSLGKLSTFYPDFVFKTTEGKIFIVDIKGEGTADPNDSKYGSEIISKANALINYCKDYEFVGGIVVIDKDTPKIFMDNKKFNYSYFKDNLVKDKGWMRLEDLLK